MKLGINGLLESPHLLALVFYSCRDRNFWRAFFYVDIVHFECLLSKMFVPDFSVFLQLNGGGVPESELA